MDTKALRELPIEELQAELNKLLQQIINLRILKGSKQTVKPHLFKQTRKAIACIKTIVAEKMREGN